MKDKLWNLFKKTGDIRVFNLLEKVEGNKYASSKSRRNGNR